MSLIIWDGNCIVADTVAIYGHMRKNVPVRKLEIQDGYIFAAVGHSAIFSALIKWYLTDKDDPSKMPGNSGQYYDTDFMVWCINDLTYCHYYTTKGGYPNTYHPCMAFGILDSYAEGCMDAGLSAIATMRKAVTRCGDIALPMDVIDLSNPTEIVRLEK